MPQYSSSKNALMPTGPKAKHQLRYKYYDFRDIISGDEFYTKICSVAYGRYLVVAIPQRRVPNGVGGYYIQGGEVSLLKVDRNGVLYNREIIDEGTNGQAYLGANLSVYSSTGNTFTMAYGTRDGNGLRSVIVKQYHKSFEQVQYTYTIANPDQTGTSAVGGGDDSFGSFSGTIHLLSEDSLIITSPDYDNGLSGGTQLAGRLYRYSRSGSTWSLTETKENLSIDNTRFSPYTWGYSVSGVENSGGAWQYMVGWPRYSAFASSFRGAVTFYENSTSWGTIGGSTGEYLGSNVYMNENYMVVVAAEETDANGDECVIRVYNKPENFSSGFISGNLLFSFGTPPVVYPFRGNGTGDTVNNRYWGGPDVGAVDLGNQIKIDNDMLYVMNIKARPNAEGQDGAISKHDLVTGQFIDYYHLPDRGTPSGTDLAPSFDVYSGRAFVLVGQDAKPPSVSGSVIMGTGIHVIDDLIKPDSFWDEGGETVVAIEQVSTKALTTTYTNMEAVDNEGYRAIEFFNNDRDLALQELTFPLDMPTSGWFTLEVISKIDRTSSNQVVLQLKHASNSSLDLFYVIGTTNQATKLYVGSVGGSTGTLANIAHSDTRYIHLGFGWETDSQTTQNWLVFNEGGGIQATDSSQYLDIPSNYNELIIGTTDTGTGADLNAGWIAQIKISSVQQYGPGNPFFNYTDPTSANSRLEMDNNTIFMWEAPTYY